MHILIISDPPVAPGFLPRVRYLCDYMRRSGYDVTYITEEVQPLDFAHDYPVITIPMYKGGTAEWALKAAWTLLTDWYNRVFAKRALRALEGETFDLVLCSSFNDSPLGAARRIAAQRRVPLICDIRDLDEQVTDSRYQYRHRTWWTMPFRRLYRAVHIRRRNNVLRAADAVTTVSPWHVDFIKQFNPDTHLVYNGYDANRFFPEDIPSDTFRITYIGSLFDWQQPALQRVRQAIDELNQLLITNHTPQIVFDLHTPQHNTLTHDQLGDAIRRSCIMLVFTHPDTHGMLTTKFYEALGCDKPVLCVPSDQGALAELMAYTHAGIASDDLQQIKTFILDQYNLWRTQGFTRQHATHREQFSREVQTSIIEQLIRRIHNL